METTIIHLLRHGEVYNPEGLLYGRMPGYRLSNLGEAMAQRVADTLVLRGHNIKGIVSSPLLRAQQTAQPTSLLYELPVESDERLIEAENDFEGEVINRNRWVLVHPSNWQRYVNPFRPSWGESYQAQVLRMRAAVSTSLRRYMGAEALLVSHQLPIWCLRRFITGKPLAHDPRRRECSLASLTSLTFSDTTLVGLTYWEPAADLLNLAYDMTPGNSVAQLNAQNLSNGSVD